MPLKPITPGRGHCLITGKHTTRPLFAPTHINGLSYLIFSNLPCRHRLQGFFLFDFGDLPGFSIRLGKPFVADKAGIGECSEK